MQQALCMYTHQFINDGSHRPIHTHPQTDYCARRGIGCKRSGGSSTGGSGSVGGWAYFPYRLSVPYAGASLECVVTLPVPLASAQAAPAGAEEEAGLWDDDVGEGDDTEVRVWGFSVLTRPIDWKP